MSNCKLNLRIAFELLGNLGERARGRSGGQSVGVVRTGLVGAGMLVMLLLLAMIDDD
jgi:hypothetical protein